MTISAQKNPDMIDYLRRRRSVSLSLMGDKCPNDEEVRTILDIAMRTPDHGKMFPWYFIVIKGNARQEIGKLLSEAYKTDEDPNASDAKLELESERFLRAPMAILVVSRIREGKHPLWEQYLSSGAVCAHLSLACHGLGYGVNWLSEWYSFSPTFKTGLGLDERDNIAGVMYIGNIKDTPEERPRPSQEDIVTYWTSPETPLNKGEEYGQPGKGFPPLKLNYPEGIE